MLKLFWYYGLSLWGNLVVSSLIISYVRDCLVWRAAFLSAGFHGQQLPESFWS